MTTLEALAARLASLEQRLAPIERLFHTATGLDPCIDEDTEALRKLIADAPGMSQAGITRVARGRCELSKARVIELLRSGVGKHWMVNGGMYNSLLYYPMAYADGTHSQNTSLQVIVKTVDENEDTLTA